MPATMTREEMRVRLQKKRSQPKTPDIRTSEEWQEYWGVGKHKARYTIRWAIEQGLMEQVLFHTTNTVGARIYKPGYRLTRKGKAVQK